MGYLQGCKPVATHCELDCTRLHSYDTEETTVRYPLLCPLLCYLSVYSVDCLNDLNDASLYGPLAYPQETRPAKTELDKLAPKVDPTTRQQQADSGSCRLFGFGVIIG